MLIVALHLYIILAVTFKFIVIVNHWFTDGVIYAAIASRTPVSDVINPSHGHLGKRRNVCSGSFIQSVGGTKLDFGTTRIQSSLQIGKTNNGYVLKGFH